jgi:hypothetical protein
MRRMVSTAFRLASDGNLMPLFGDEVYRLARAVQTAASRAFDACPEPPPDGSNLLTVKPEIHADLAAAIGHAALLKKLLWPRPEKPTNWSHELWRFHNQRAELLQEPFDGMGLKALKDVSVRNTLEHFDEYLDREVIRVAKGRIGAEQVHIITDAVLSSRRLWDTFATPRGAATVMLRVFISDERVLLNARREVDIGAIHDECVAIEQRLDRFTNGAVAARVGGSKVHVWVTPEVRRRATDGERG